MHLPDDWSEMVLAVRFERDIAKDDDFVVARDFLKSPPQIFPGVVGISGEPLFVCANDPLWRPFHAFAVGVIARPSYQCANSILRFRPCWFSILRFIAI